MTHSGTDPRRRAHGLARLSFPLVAAQLVGVAMSTSDALLLSRAGPEALAGGGLAVSIATTVQLAGAGVLSAVVPLAATAHADGNHRRLFSVMRHGLGLAAVLGLLAAAAIAGAAALLPAAGLEPRVISVAAPFLLALAAGMPAALIATAARNGLVAMGRGSHVTVCALVAAIVNLGAAAALLFGAGPVPALGAVGVGVTTSLVHVGVAVALGLDLRRVLRADGPARVEGELLAGPVDRALLRAICSLGIPAAGLLGMEVAFFQLAGIFVGRLGVAALAAHQAGLTVSTLVFVVPLGIAQAAGVLVARADGTQGRGAARRVGLRSLTAATVVALVLAGTLAAAAPTVARVAFGVRVAGDLAMTSQVFVAAACFHVFDALQVVAVHALRALRDTRYALVVGLLGYALVGPATAWLAAVVLGLGLVGVWVGLAAGLFFVAVALVRRFLLVTRPRPARRQPAAK